MFPKVRSLRARPFFPLPRISRLLLSLVALSKLPSIPYISQPCLARITAGSSPSYVPSGLSVPGLPIPFRPLLAPSLLIILLVPEVSNPPCKFPPLLAWTRSKFSGSSVQSRYTSLSPVK